MYIDSLTIAAVIVFIVYLAAFIFGCVLHECNAAVEDETSWEDDLHQGKGTWIA
ncbi:MAG: hypothetical protein PVJ15_01625 [Gammaproteobacteria bacterium]|jgi:hypothetical protein